MRQMKPRLRTKRLPTGKWVAVKLDGQSTEIARSPEVQTEREAEAMRDNMRRYGAWLKS